MRKVYSVPPPRPGNEIETSGSQRPKSKIAAESSCEGACFRKVFSSLFSVRLASALADPACSQDLGVMQPCVCFDYSSCGMFDYSKQLPCVNFLWSLGHLSFTLCERSSRWTEQTARLNYKRVQCSDGSIGKSGKRIRFCSACAGARRSTLTPCDYIVVHFCLACLRGSHCLSVRLCLSCTSSIWRREIYAHPAHRPDGRFSVF